MLGWEWPSRVPTADAAAPSLLLLLLLLLLVAGRCRFTEPDLPLCWVAPTAAVLAPGKLPLLYWLDLPKPCWLTSLVAGLWGRYVGVPDPDLPENVLLLLLLLLLNSLCGAAAPLAAAEMLLCLLLLLLHGWVPVADTDEVVLLLLLPSGVLSSKRSCSCLRDKSDIFLSKLGVCGPSTS
jgi:hypothetical protein